MEKELYHRAIFVADQAMAVMLMNARRLKSKVPIRKEVSLVDLEGKQHRFHIYWTYDGKRNSLFITLDEKPPNVVNALLAVDIFLPTTRPEDLRPGSPLSRAVLCEVLSFTPGEWT